MGDFFKTTKGVVEYVRWHTLHIQMTDAGTEQRILAARRRGATSPRRSRIDSEGDGGGRFDTAYLFEGTGTGEL